jgi:hypothetical protein
MERVQSGEGACVLVQEDGKYRLEKTSPAKVEIYTGFLDSVRVEQIKGLIASDQLRKIAQADINRPLVTDAFDALQLSIWRDPGWQTLTFIAPDSRRPFKESLDPLLHWFGDLRKQRPSATRAEGPATRCMPRPTPMAVQADTSVVANLAATHSHANFLFRLHSTYLYQANAETTCTVVFGDGSYHWEHSGQSYRGTRQGKVADGQLQPGTMQGLREVLSSSGLEKSPGNPDVGQSPPFQEGTFTVLSIPRENQVQRLTFFTFFNTRNDPSDMGGMSNARYRVTDDKLMEPLKKWIKENIDPAKRRMEKSGTGNDCLPFKGDATGDKSSN